MNITKCGNKLHSSRHLTLAGLIVVGGWLLGVGQVWAQLPVGQSSGTAQLAAGDSVVYIVADMASLPSVPLSEVPSHATFWFVSPMGGPRGIQAVPLPFPPTDPNVPIFAITPDGQQFLVDATGGQLLPTTRHQSFFNSPVWS